MKRLHWIRQDVKFIPILAILLSPTLTESIWTTRMPNGLMPNAVAAVLLNKRLKLSFSKRKFSKVLSPLNPFKWLQQVQNFRGCFKKEILVKSRELWQIPQCKQHFVTKPIVTIIWPNGHHLMQHKSQLFQPCYSRPLPCSKNISP